MSRFSEEMSIIPLPARILSAAVGLGVPALCIVTAVFFLLTHRPEVETGFLIVPFVATLIAVFVGVYILVIGYITGDSRRRGMRPVLWTLLAIFIPNAIGIILYFILRDPLLQHCPRCGASANSQFSFCPVCGATLSESCPSCRSIVQQGWSHCGRCGFELHKTQAAG